MFSAPRRSRTSRRAVAVMAIALTGALASCSSGQVRVTEYGAEAEFNFVNACTETHTIEDGRQVTTELAPEAFCKCVYQGISKTHPLPWDELTDYDEEVANADDGDMPTPPQQLTESIEDCSTTGPQAPGADSEESDESTTTEAE